MENVSNFFSSLFEKERLGNLKYYIENDNDIIKCTTINNKFEKKIPDIGLVDLIDAETGDVVTVDTSSLLFRELWQNDFKNDIDLNQIFEIILQESPELYIK
jgi:hypothetical protein